MNTIKNQTKKGFTIIEVVLVLAIAGLIFLMVFLALPALQRSQRDTTRKNDASRLLAAVNDSRAANRGQLPAAGANVNTQIVNRYVTVGGSTFVDPASGNPYATGTILNGAQAGNIGAGTMQVIRNAQCGDNGTAVAGNGVVIRAGVESSPNVAYCLQG